MKSALTPEEFIQQLQKECDPLRQRCLEHPFVCEVEEGKLPVERLKRFALQDYWLLKETYRLGALAILTAPDLWAQELILQKVSTELGHNRMLLKFARALGLKDEEVERAEPLAGTMALTNYFFWISAFGSPGERGAAIGASEEVFAPISGRMAEGLKTHYGLTSDDVEFFEVHAVSEVEHHALEKRILASYAETEEARRKIRRAARLGYEYEAMFFDAVYGG